MPYPIKEGEGVPELKHGSGSWVCTSPTGEVREFRKRSNAALAGQHGWHVEDVADYLARLNKQVSEK